MNGSQIGTRPFREKLLFRNVDAAVIPIGAPVILAINATEDGFAAHLPSSSSAAKCPELFAGVYTGSNALAVNDVGNATIWGFCTYAIIAVQSRVASTNSFVSAAALSIGQPLAIDTINNAFKIGSQVTGAFTIVTNATTDTLAINFGDGNPPMAVMAQTYAAQVSSASTTSDTRVAVTAGLKVFLRAM